MAQTTIQEPRDHIPIQERPIVSSFLFKLCDAETRAIKVALFRRSDEVRTYQHHLAPISGSINPQTDETPVEAAWRELKEETTLTPATVTLWRKGRQFSFRDESVGREWIIHPFAFLLKAPVNQTKVGCEANYSNDDGGDGIMLDWEHNFYNWHDPGEILSRLDENGANAMVCGQMLVPRIADSLISVYPEYRLGSTAGRRLREGLEQLQHDHESGARELATISLNILRDILVEVRPSKMQRDRDEDSWEVWWMNVRLVVWHLWTNGRESMGTAIASALFWVLADLEELYQNKHGEDDIDRLIESAVKKRTEMTERLREAFNSYVREYLYVMGDSGYEQKKTLRLVTLSASSTIREVILYLLNRIDQETNIETLEVRILESRPLFEGVTLASSIVSSVQSMNDGRRDNDSTENTKPKSRIHVTVYTDTSAALAARDADMFLLGADRIASNGAVSNKTGSLPAILAAKHISPQTKILVLSELDKVAGEGSKANHTEEEDNDAEEVVRGWRLAGVKGVDVIDGRWGREGRDAALAVRNVYFEWVPPDLIDAYITEDGVKGVADICGRSAWVSQQVRRYFDNL